jgi:hypothetical protein
MYRTQDDCQDFPGAIQQGVVDLMAGHETVSSFRKISLGSNRKFGLTFCIIFVLFGIWPLLHDGGSPRWGVLAVAAGFLIFAAIAPNRLEPLNRAWFKLGLVLSRIVNPIIMGILFFGIVTPFGWYLRWRGKDLLHSSIEPEVSTDWSQREPPGPARGTLAKQF